MKQPNPSSGDKTTMEERFKASGLLECEHSDSNGTITTLDFIRSEISQAITARDKQWLEVVGEIEKQKYGRAGALPLEMSPTDAFNHGVVLGSNRLRHQIKDKMGLGGEVELISPLVVE